VRVLVINPNTTGTMTAMVTQRLRLRMEAGTQFRQMTAATGHAVIATRQAFDEAGPTGQGMLKDAMTGGEAFDAVLLACFGDPGLEAMQAFASVPVTGLAQASMRYAEVQDMPWAIVTAGPAWKDILEQRLAPWGASALFKGVHVLAGSGAAVLQDPVGMLPVVAAAIEQARRAGAINVVLGGAVFAGWRDLMSQHGLATDCVIDCVDAAAAAMTAATS